jgi:hypothetical protein
MRPWFLCALVCSAACGSGQKEVKADDTPTRDLGPIEIGPVPPEQRKVDSETYAIELDGAPSATVKQKVVATVTVRAKGDLYIQNVKDWTLEPTGPRDTDVTNPVLAPISAQPQTQPVQTVVQYKFTVVPLRVGTKHVTLRIGGQVCNHDFCDVVSDQVSFNLDVK